MQRHMWAIDVIWFLTVQLCHVEPRVLDTCSLTIRTICMWDHESPQPELESYIISWGHKVVWGFITILYLCHALLLIYDCAWSACTIQEQMWNVFAVSTSPVTLSGSQSFTAVVANPGSIPKRANFVAGSLVGWPPEIFYESCDRFVVNASLGSELVFRG